MTAYSGTLNVASSYYPEDWRIASKEWSLDLGDYIGAVAIPDSAGDYTLNSPDFADRLVTLVPEQPYGVVWSPALTVTAGMYVRPTTFAGKVYRAGGSGTTGGSEPSWGTTHAGTTSDNGITWACVDYLGMAADKGPHVQGPYVASKSAVYNYFAATAVLYSLRRVNAQYAGACIRVRRSSDNAERDIGFVGEWLNIAELLSFVGSATGQITAWHDQSGSRHTASQATNSRQPFIVDSGALLTVNGLPALDFRGSQWLDFTSSGSSLFTSKSYANIFSVHKADTTTAAGEEIIAVRTNGSVNRIDFRINSTSNRQRLGGRRLDANSFQSITSDTDHGMAQHQYSGLIEWANSDAYLYQDGVLVASSTSYQTDGDSESSNSLGLTIGAGATGGSPLDGQIQELMLYNTDQSANRAAIEASQAGYWM